MTNPALDDPRLSDEQRAALRSAASGEPLGELEIEVFEANEQYPVEKLHEAVKQFESGAHAPPLVIGHPKLVDGKPDPVSDDRPAWGLGSALKVVGNKLKTVFAKVPQSIRKAVEAGRFPKVSAELYRNKNGAGALLRRVALLGAAPPAIKGLNAEGPVWRFASTEPAFDAFALDLNQEAPVADEPKPAEANPLMELIQSRLTALAAQSDSEDINAVMQKVADAVGLTPMELANGAELDEDKQARLAAALDVPLEDVRAAMGQAPAAPAEEEPMDANAEKDKDKTLDVHAELSQTQGALEVANAAIKELREQAAKDKAAANERTSALEARVQNQDLDAFCERLRKEYGLAGKNLSEVRSYIAKQKGLDRFADGDEQDPIEAVKPVIEMLAKRGAVDTSGRRITADASDAEGSRLDAFAEIDATEREWKKDPLGKAGGLDFRFYAYGKGHDRDVVAEWAEARKSKDKE